MVVFEQKSLYSFESGCFWAKCLGKVFAFWQNCLCSGKVNVFGQKWL